MQPIDLKFLLLCHDHGMIHGIRYHWGAKPVTNQPLPTTDRIRMSDCSGWTQYLLARQGITIPEGSYEQMEWFQKQGLPLLTADQYRSRLWRGSPLIVAFIVPVTGEHEGHVWFAHGDPTNGAGYVTAECYGCVGVGERPYNTRILMQEVHAGFVLPVR